MEIEKGTGQTKISKKQPREYPVTVELEGKRYTGFYAVSSGVITVESEWGELRAHTGSKAELTAGQLFLKILQGAKSRGELENVA
jgi:hypothetical protein